MGSRRGMYEIFEHTADLGIRVRAGTWAELLAEAGRGFLAVLVSNPEAVEPAESVAIEVKGAHREDLLVDWLDELLYTFATQRLLLTRFDVRPSASGISATAHGEPFDPARHVLDREVKAITYHGLVVREEPNGWLAEVILDL
ncbi:MAG: archease [Pirellulales bacterium]|nr:archease [Pirellulales bacterium]